MYEGPTVPQPGDLLLCYDSALLDAAIDTVEKLGMLRRQQKPPLGRPIYSHVAVYIGGGQCIEALGSGLVLTDARNHHGKADVWTQNIGSARRARIVAKAQQCSRKSTGIPIGTLPYSSHG